MATEPNTQPAAPADASAPDPKKTRREIAALWYDAETDAERKELVAQYPDLKLIFSEAQKF